ncbi:MAG: NB-ARC domain-containing protein [Pseudonocardiaceae bacterium]
MDPAPEEDDARVDARNSQGVQVGPGGLQINVYAEARSVRWPHRVGAVPLLAYCFQERVPQMRGLDEAVSAGRTAVVTQVLSGLGGVGKTQLASVYARRVWGEGELDLLVWVTARSRGAVQARYAQVAAEIGQMPPGEVERAAEWFLGWMQTTTRRWLVVLDDLSDPADLQGLWPEGACGRVLVTTGRRDAALAGGARQVIEVGLYTPGQALAYLREKTGDDATPEDAAGLAAELGYLPLALAQAAAYLRDRHETYAGYRRRVRDRRRRLAELFPSDALADDYRSTVAATWSISLEVADRLLPAGLATPLLRLAGTLDPNGVPIEVFTTPAALSFLTDQYQPPEPADVPRRVQEQDCRDALSNLHRLNLISLDRGGGPRAVCTHALVQRATLDPLPTDALAATVRAAADAVLAVWPQIERDTTLGQALRDCAMTLKERHNAPLWIPEAHPTLFRTGQSLGECGLVSAAVHYWTQTATDAVDALGVDHPDTLSTQHNLAYWREQAHDQGESR